MKRQKKNPSSEYREKSSEYISTLKLIWTAIALVTLLFGVILFCGGIGVAIVGSQANTTFTLLGQQFTSTSVGVALAFIGAVMVVFIFRRLMSSVDNATLRD